MSAALLMALCASLAAEPESRLDADVAFTYGFGSHQAFGGFVEARYAREAWRGAFATGELEAGLLLGYQAEPLSLLSGLLGDIKMWGFNHRVAAWFVLGHAFRVPASQRLRLSVSVFSGWTQLWVSGGLEDAAHGVRGEARATAGAFSTGLMASVGFALTERLAMTARFTAPFPYAMAVNPWFLASLGVAVRLD